MTSAPMSASISVQVGPAITCVRSTTFSPLRGPIVSPAILFVLARCSDCLFAGPLRLALVEEGIHAFAEIPALIAHQDQVLVFGRLRLGTKQRLLGGTQRQGSMAGDKPRQFISPPFERGE